MILQLAIGFLLGAAVAAPVTWALMRRRGGLDAQRANRAESRVRDAERLAYVGQLAGGLAHEIKNPLSTLSLNLQLLAEDWRAEDRDSPVARRVGRKIELLQREADRLSGVLDDFLHFARGHELKLVDGDLNATLEEVLTFFDPEARQRGVTLRRGLGPTPPVRIDSELIRQMMLNMLVNAQQAMPDGGEAIVRTSVSGDDALIEVIDTGCGIAPEDRDKVFKPYFSTKKGGTGLGLPMARRIVEEHGGEMGFESEPGKGTRFFISLPLSRSGEEPQAEVS